MKKYLYLTSGAISFIYIIVYCLNVSDIVANHMDSELFIPIHIMVFSLLLSVVMLIADRKKKIDKKLFIIPLMFFISAVITFIVGCYTPCELCTL